MRKLIPALSPSIAARMPIDWPVLVGLALLHLGAVAAVLWFSWFALGFALLLLWLTSSLGISLAFHRMLAHRSFRPKRWLQLALVAMGCLAMQGRPFYWVGVHRLHHADPDGPMDPHTPRHGLWWSHAGWMLRQNSGGEQRVRVIPDLARDPALTWLNRWTPLLQALSLGAIFGIGEVARAFGLETSGWSCLLWAGGLRVVVAYHATWLVNSATHRWGYVNYPTRDDARNLWWVAILTFGEGWHNNHHAYAHSAKIGHRWFEFDVSWLALRLFALIGLVSSIKLPKDHGNANAPRGYGSTSSVASLIGSARHSRTA
jgi:fatty-acid desaturase